MLRISVSFLREILSELLDDVLVLRDEGVRQRLRCRIRHVLRHDLVDVIGMLADGQLVLVIHRLGCFEAFPLFNVLFRFQISMQLLRDQNAELYFVAFVDATDSFDERH